MKCKICMQWIIILFKHRGSKHVQLQLQCSSSNVAQLYFRNLEHHVKPSWLDHDLVGYAVSLNGRAVRILCLMISTTDPRL